jgi:16S rRNA (cytidine1402-2'-O)-methyltransferase
MVRPMSGAVLYVVSTPLGNLHDLSPRGVEVLRTADLLYAEDTRTAGRLLHELGINRNAKSCFDGNEEQRSTEVLEHFAQGLSVALFSEAGTPAVSDPGYRMVRAAIDANVRVVPVPGPSAVLSALVASGLATDRFYFGGFLPRKAGARRQALGEVKNLDATLIYFESPMRTAETLSDMLAVFGDRPAVVARELTKTYEEFVRAPLSALITKYEHDRPLGEITLVVSGATQGTAEDNSDEALKAKAEVLLAQGLSAKDAAQKLAFDTGIPRRQAYALILGLGRS